MLSLSPINRPRWTLFKQNKRSFWALRIFVVLFGLCLCAELIANDKPLLVRYQEQWFIPVLFDYPQSRFAGDPFLNTDFHDPAITQEIAQHGFALWPPIPYHPARLDYDLAGAAPVAPSAQHWLGTDLYGRDLIALALYGLRLSLLFGFILAITASGIGILVGAIQGYFGGKIDIIGQRFLEVWGGMPELFILIILTGIISPSFWSLLMIMLAFSWTALVGVVRAEFLRTRNFDYVRAARALGVSNPLIMWRHILPNAMVATLTFLPFILTGSLATLTTLDFLGLGLPVGTASLGDLLRQGKENPHAPWIGLMGFIVMGITLSTLVFIGEGVRDALNPKRTLQRVSAIENQ